MVTDKLSHGREQLGAQFIHTNKNSDIQTIRYSEI